MGPKDVRALTFRLAGALLFGGTAIFMAWEPGHSIFCRCFSGTITFGVLAGGVGALTASEQMLALLEHAVETPGRMRTAAAILRVERGEREPGQLSLAHSAEAGGLSRADGDSGGLSL